MYTKPRIKAHLIPLWSSSLVQNFLHTFMHNLTFHSVALHFISCIQNETSFLTLQLRHTTEPVYLALKPTDIPNSLQIQYWAKMEQKFKVILILEPINHLANSHCCQQHHTMVQVYVSFLCGFQNQVRHVCIILVCHAQTLPL